MLLFSELSRVGADISTALWSGGVLRASPATVRDVHVSFFKAGANIATTSSYQLTVPGVAAVGSDEPELEFVALLRRSVDVACEARDIVCSLDSASAGSVTPRLVSVRPVLCSES